MPTVIKSPEDMKTSIMEEIAWDKRIIDSSGIIVEVIGATARLTGTVPSYSDRRHAAMDALCTPGITAVDNQLTVTHPGYYGTPSDASIQSDARSILALNSNLPSARIRVSASGGTVTLRGSVDSYWQKLRTEELISDVSGVQGIRNELTVVPTETYDDESIAASIISAIERTMNININQINVTVENGSVWVSGSIPDWLTHRRIIEIISHTGGVRSVHDNLSQRKRV